MVDVTAAGCKEGVSPAPMGVVGYCFTGSMAMRTAATCPERIRAAVDDAFVGPDAPIAGAREIALFPPVTGG